MKLVWSWLTEWLPLSWTPSELADRLTAAGFEIESIHHFGGEIRGIVTARIDTITPHPNADRLQITQVHDGKSTHQIVTGATNIKVGDVVPVSLPGAVLANGLVIESRPLRGVPSHGMLCSKSELGLPSDEEGIWILPPDTALGLDWVKAALLSDTLLDVAILPNRGDCQSMWGLAREISVLADCPLPTLATDYTTHDLPFSTHLDAPHDGCRHLSLTPLYYHGGHVPITMQRRLECMGLRLIHPVVDVLNYAMLECGQPFHAYRHADGLTFRVAPHNSEEPMPLLDGTDRLVPTDALMVWHGDKRGAIAGIMGSRDTGLTADTTACWIESAYFDPAIVRKTARAMGLRTDSLARFEKGVDPCQVAHWRDRALHWLDRVLSVQIGSTACSWTAPNWPAQPYLPFNPDAINRLLGTDLPSQPMISWLHRLGFVQEGDRVRVPSWRHHDVCTEACLAEEVARMMGYDHLPTSTQLPMVPQTPPTRLSVLSEQSMSFWRHQGMTQVHTFTMVSPDEFTRFSIPQPSDGVTIQNPLSVDQSVLRRYLMPSLLRVVQHHHARQCQTVAIAEVGKVFFETPGGSIRENTVLGVMATGPIYPHSHRPDRGATWTFDHLKGLTVEWLTSLNMDLEGLEWDGVTYPMYHPTCSADARVGATVVGNVGFVHPAITDEMGIRTPVAYIGFSLSSLARMAPKPIANATPPSRYPDSRRDLSFIAPSDLRYAEIDRLIRDHLPAEAIHFELFDRFEGPPLGDNEVSYALSFVYQSSERTLSDDEVSLVHQGLCESLKRSLPITMRA